MSAGKKERILAWAYSSPDGTQCEEKRLERRGVKHDNWIMNWIMRHVR